MGQGQEEDDGKDKGGKKKQSGVMKEGKSTRGNPT
jgi:hypothetical protein